MNPYKSMHFLSDSDYKQFKQWQSTLRDSPETLRRHTETLRDSPETHGESPKKHGDTLTCDICSRRCKNAAVLAHHHKSHVSGYQCNICKKVFLHKRSLKLHLRGHPPQAIPKDAAPTYASNAPTYATYAPTNAPVYATYAPAYATYASNAPDPQLKCKVCGKQMVHKRNLYRHMQSHKLFKTNTNNWIAIKHG